MTVSKLIKFLESPSYHLYNGVILSTLQIYTLTVLSTEWLLLFINIFFLLMNIHDVFCSKFKKNILQKLLRTFTFFYISIKSSPDSVLQRY